MELSLAQVQLGLDVMLPAIWDPLADLIAADAAVTADAADAAADAATVVAADVG